MLRTYQKDCYRKLHESRDLGDEKCLVLMFCGTGKTRVFHTFMRDFTFSVAVFPTLALVDQFMTDYVERGENNGEGLREFCHLRVSSDSEDAKTSTDSEKIRRFLEKKCRKIVAVTYASLGLLFAVMKDVGCRADVIVYDEAHHVIGDKCQTLVFDKDVPVDFQAFFTATYRNANGIVMYNEGGVSGVEGEHCPISDCGRCIFRYTLPQAIEDGVCQDFEFCVFLSHCKDAEAESDTDKVERNLRMIANAIVSNDCRRVIINHAFSEAEDDTRTSIATFATKANEKILKSAIKKLDVAGKYKKVVYNGVGSKHKRRAEIINAFNTDTEDEVHIISQCKIFSEGIDTRQADMTVFIDEKGSCHVIIQIIGRVTRKKSTDKKGIILIPIIVDIDSINEAKTREERDEILRDCINEERNFNPILNVMTALREEDPEYYEMCLRYPFSFSPLEIEKRINESGRVLESSKGTLKDNIEYLVGGEVGIEEDEDDLERVAEIIQKPIRVITQNMEDGKTFENYGEEYGGDVVEMFRNEEGEYQPIKSKGKSGEGVVKKDIEKPKRKPFGNKIKVQTESGVKILWDIAEMRETLTDEIIVSLESEMMGDDRVEKWKENLEKVKEFIRENGKRPVGKSKNAEEKRLGKWIDHQITNFNNDKKCMQNITIKQFWNDFILSEEFKPFFCKNNEKWINVFNDVKEFIRENGKRPSDISKNIIEKQFGNWVSTQIKNYKSRMCIMTTNEIFDIWTTFILCDEFKEFFQDKKEEWTQKWYHNLEKAKTFMRNNDKRPSIGSKDVDEKSIGKWVDHQLTNIKNKIGMISENNKLCKVWLEFKLSDEFEKYFVDQNDRWKQNLEDLKIFMNKTRDRPNKRSKNLNEKQLAGFLSTQLGNSRGRKHIMKDDDIFQCWNDFVLVFGKYFQTTKDIWINNLEITKQFIRKSSKRPPQSDSQWLSGQIRYSKPDNRKHIMKDDHIFQLWKDFILSPEFAQYFPAQQSLYAQEEPEIFLVFTCSVCNLDFPLELEVNCVCPSCISQVPPPKSPITTLSRPPPPIKTLEECKDKASTLSQDQLIEKVAKKAFQEQKGYRPSTKKSDPDKQRANLLFAERSSQKIGIALILDSQNFLTTTALIESGYNREDISIPQYDKTEYLVQKKEHNNVSNQSLNAFLQDTKIEKFSTAWFDYTCTYSGNVGCRPKDDIELYFSRKFPENESTFAVTFSKREKADEEESRVDDTRRHISLLAKKNGYALTDEVKFEYGNMYFIMWEVLERRV
jgi:superfamily II DNA or RNA helicase